MDNVIMLKFIAINGLNIIAVVIILYLFHRRTMKWLREEKDRRRKGRSVK